MADLSVVVIDSKEKNMEIFNFLAKNDVKVEIAPLDVGDILIMGISNFLIERKTESDFASSLVDGRLFKQMRELVENSETSGFTPILLFVGDRWKLWKFRNFRPFQIAGALNAIQFKFGIQIIDERTDSAAAMRILNLVKMFDPEEIKPDKVYPIRTISKKGFSEIEYTRGILEGFPGISSTLSTRWVGKFGSLKECLKAIDTEKVLEIDRFGKKRLEKIKEVYK